MLGPDFLPGLNPVQDALGDGHLLRVAQLQGGLLIRQPAPSIRPFLSLANSHEKLQIPSISTLKINDL
jgi:hypothetical protein